MDYEIEVEALESTYNSVQVERDGTGSAEVRVPLQPYTGDGALHFVACTLALHLPIDYPDDAPLRARLEATRGLSDRRIAALQALLDKQSAELQGEPALMAVCMTVQEQLSGMNFPDGAQSRAGASRMTLVQKQGRLGRSMLCAAMRLMLCWLDVALVHLPSLCEQPDRHFALPDLSV